MNRKNPLIYVFSGSFAALSLVALSYGCSASNDPSGGEGGSPAKGGAVSTGQGGATNPAQGGAQTGQGGAQGQGGSQTGQGGAASGGAASGGASTGQGGASAQGGANTAGSSNGGANTAGSSSAGASNGGANTAGSSSAGASNGGANTAGSSSAGASNGGANTAGSSSAGASNGGASSMCPATNTDANCTSSLAKSGAACTQNCCLGCGFNSMGSRVCTCTGGTYASCSCPRPATYMGKNLSNNDPATGPACANSGTVAGMKGMTCTTEWEQCITSDAPSGTTYQGCVCMMGSSGLQWYCGSTNKWFGPAQ